MAPSVDPTDSGEGAIERLASPKAKSGARGMERDQLALQLRQEYEAGATIFQLSRKHGKATSTVHVLLREVGTSFRPRGISRK
jgi:hypothetical protein